MAKAQVSPEDEANFISNLFFWWTLPVFRKGNARVLEESDMYPLRQERESKKLSHPLATAWAKTVAQNQPSLLRSMVRVYWPKFTRLGLIYLFKEALLQVFLSLVLGQFLRAYGSSAQSQSTTVSYIGLVFIVLSTIYAFVTNHWYLSSVKLGFSASVAVTVLVFQKILRIRPSVVNMSDSASPINLLAGDTKRFETNIGFLHALWVGPTVFVIVGTILWVKYGPEVMAGFLMMLFLSSVGGLIGKMFIGIRKRTAGNTDERLKLIDNIISQIRIIKTDVWERLFVESVEAARQRELRDIRHRQLLLGISANIQAFYSRLTILATLLTYVFVKDPITAEKVFVAMSFYNIVAGIMSGSFPAAVVIMAELRVAISRIESFLLLPESDRRGVEHLPGKPSPFKTYGKVSMSEYSGSWGKESVPAINNLTLKLGAGHPVFVLGSFGSGKSSMLYGILGELETIGGKIEVEGRLSLAAQAPWAYTGTLQENILFGKPLSQPWYQQVLDATELIEDIRRFPERDLTLVGDKGMTLSGGQRARINLARALYTDADVYLLDDVLSAVDPHVGEEIWRKAIKGLLKEKCVLVATNQVEFITNDDHVLLLEGGKVKDFGLRIEVEQRHPLQFTQNHTMRGKEEPAQEQFNSLRFHRGIGSSKWRDESSELSPLLSMRKSSLRENRRTGMVGLSLCWQYLRAGNSFSRLIIVLSLFLFTQVGMSTSDIWLTKWTDFAEKSGKESDWFYPGIYVGFIVGVFFIGWISVNLYSLVLVSSGRQLHANALNALVATKLTFFDQNPSGRILNRFSKDISNVDENLGLILFGVISWGLQVIGVIGVACFFNPFLIPPSIILFGIFYFLRRFYLSASSDIKRLEAITRSSVYSFLNVALEGIPTVRAFKQQQYMLDTFCRLKDTHSRTYFMLMFSYAWFTLAFSLTILTFQTVVICTFIYFISDKAAAALIITTVFTLSEMFGNAVQSTADLENDLVSVERIAEYGALPREGAMGGTDRWMRGAGEIYLENVQLNYGEHNPALKGVTVHIKPAEKVGVIGRTGAGKSSIVAALLRLTEPSGGRILINGVNTHSLLLRELRSNISVVSQTPGFLKGTLRRNLDPFDQHSDAEIWSILGSLQLLSKVKQHPDTIYQAVDVGGSNFSQGERQLISLGRVLLAKKRIVILDEASANLDIKTDEIIQSVIRDKLENVTVIAIAHRWETISNYDRILVLEDGRVTDFDTPQVIFSRQKKLEL